MLSHQWGSKMAVAAGPEIPRVEISGINNEDTEL